MAILESMASRGAGPSSKRSGIVTRLSLISLTFQNSLLILIMHYSRVMPIAGDHRYFTSTAVLLTEIIKFAVSLTLTMYESSKTLAPSTPASVLLEQICNAVFSEDGWKLAMPAAFYTLQNMLQYVAIGNLDAVQFQVLYQLKIIITALFTVFLLNRPLGLRRWLSLVMLTFGVSIVSLPYGDGNGSGSLFLHGVADHFFPRSLHELGHDVANVAPATPHLTRRSATYEGILEEEDLVTPDALMNYTVGLTSVLAAAAISGLTGVYFEKLLKESPTQASVWIRNLQLSMYSSIAAFLGGVCWQDGAGIREHGFFEGYNSVVWAAIGLQAAGGLVGSLVIRDADNIVKNFAMSISIVISFVLSVWLFDFPVTLTFLTGTSLVLCSTYLYSVPERGPGSHRPAPIRIATFEKPMIESLRTPGATPRGDLTRLNVDPMESAGSGLKSPMWLQAPGLGFSSSRPASPMLPRQPSRSNIQRDE